MQSFFEISKCHFSFATKWKDLTCSCSYLYCLSVVNFDNMKAETVDSFSRRHEDASRWIKMAAHVYQDLRRKLRKMAQSDLEGSC